jgi:outer membrane protein OmpA-like peptidoglycan-associated protein
LRTSATFFAREATALLGLFTVVLAAGCGPGRIAQPTAPTRLKPTLIVLLPDPETGTTGRARVSNEFGSADLAAPRAGTRTADGSPGPVKTISETDVTRLFGAALAALPPASRHFTLHFKFESGALTDESTALVPTILEAVKALSVPEVVVVGHTDTMGDSKANVALGLKRAMTVRSILVKAGLALSTVEATSHGEADLLVKTPDNTPEPRNRRVEITVR